MGLEFDFTQLQGKLEELDRKVQKGISDKALKAGGEIILREQRITVPKDTGALAASLIVGKISGTGAKRKVLVGINPTHYETVKYGFYQEHGTRVMLGKKWMRRSWNKGKDQAQRAIGESIAEDLGGR
jgi:HK97 gp10 family phage protein